MKIKSVSITNFRRLKDISFECVDTVNSIVGPNGIGKSSILDAIRLVKAILLASSDNETQGTIANLGLSSVGFNQLLFENICRDKKADTVIEVKIEISKDDIELVKKDIQNFNISRLQNQLGQSSIASLNLVSFLSTPMGQQQFKALGEDTTKKISEFEKNPLATIKLTIGINKVQGFNGFHQEITAFLFRSPFFSESLFTVFPADRNFPTGEINIQLGQGDINQQVQSYSIQPQLKFQRLKAAIISFMMLNSNDISAIQEDFQLIFDNLIPGKQLEGIKLEPNSGRLSVLIKEDESGAVYDIDFLSSGEKGLLLTLFLLLRTVAKNGIVLIDEPELHLNPAVCVNIIPFIKQHICVKKNAQIILTTHSSEILASTKEDEGCRLLYLISDINISPILKRDDEEAQEAIKELGISTSDLLFNKGVIYLEGTTDVDFINEVLNGVVSGYKIHSLGGRSIIESEIKILQASDIKNKLNGFHIFILDNDNKATSLVSSNRVKIIQWDRYSFENYLLNVDVLYDIVKDLNPKDFPNNRTDFTRIIKELAIGQIPLLANLEILQKVTPNSISYSKKDLKGLNNSQIGSLVSTKIEAMKTNLNSFDKSNWEANFLKQAEERAEELKGDWEENWKIKSRGKDLLTDIYIKFSLQNHKEFIKSIIRKNKELKTEEWSLIIGKIQPIIQGMKR